MAPTMPPPRVKPRPTSGITELPQKHMRCRQECSKADRTLLLQPKKPTVSGHGDLDQLKGIPITWGPSLSQNCTQ